MSYTIKINDKGAKAKSIINMLKELAKDYSFMSIYEDKDDFSEDMEQELERRYKFTLQNPEIGKSWEEVRKTLINK